MFKRFSLWFVAVVVLSSLLIVPAASGRDIPWPTQTWSTSSPEAQGMSSPELAAYFTQWSQPQFNFDSLIVIRHGTIVAEAYSPLNGPETKHELFSVTKSVTSSLIGMLVQDGLLDGIDTPFLELFPDRTAQNIDARKEALTVRDLLTMGSGLECTDVIEGQGTSFNMAQSDSPVQFVLDLPMTADPGTQWYYCNAFPDFLSTVITEETGMPASEYAAEKLFAPLGISDYSWVEGWPGMSYGASGLSLTPRDMAKFGYLYLNGGQWEGQQIVPADYVDASLAKQIGTPWGAETTYGYLWWRLEPINTSFALGHGGQYIIVMPDKDMVVVATGGMTENLRVPLHGYPLIFATAALSVSDEALPEDPEGAAELQGVIEKIAAPAAQPVPALPALAAEISGQPYWLMNQKLFISNPWVERWMNYAGLTDALDVQSLSITFDESDEAVLTLVFADKKAWVLPVGLDGIYRISEGRLGTVGVRGEWLGDSTFRLWIKQGGYSALYRLDFNFIPGGMDIISYEYKSGGASVILGVAMQ